MNFSPDMMKFAMDQMGKMSPEQLQQMQQQMGSMSPDMIQQAQRMAANMGPQEWEAAQKQMAGMDGNTMQQKMAEAQNLHSSRSNYVLTASVQLKNEGNQLHAQSKFHEAIAKYERAHSNVIDMVGKEASDLRKACTLNLSSCFLNTQQWGKCVELCDEVLTADVDSLKALYRRGQAYVGLKHWLAAEADLARARKLAAAANDEAQAKLIRDKLQEVKDHISAVRASGGTLEPVTQPAAPAAAAPLSGPEDDGHVEVIHQAGSSMQAATASSSAPATATTAGSSSSSSSSSLPTIPGMSPEAVKAAAEAMQSNPEMIKQAQAMMQGMSDDQLKSMASQYGVDASPEQIRAGASSSGLGGNLTTEQLQAMMKLQQQLPDLKDPAAARDPKVMAKAAEVLSSNPDMVKSVSSMLGAMSEAQLEEFSRHAGMPAGMKMTPDMAKMMASTMANMPPEEMKKMAEMAASMPRPAGWPAQQPTTTICTPGITTTTPSAFSFSAPTAESASAESTSGGSRVLAPAADGPSTSGRGSAAAAPAAASGMAMPTMDVKQAADMLSSMSPEALEAMARAMPAGLPGMPAGMTMTPEMIKMATSMMRNMSPEDMANMQRTAMAMQGGGGSAAFASPAENPLTSSSSGTDSAAALAASSVGAMPSFPGMPAGMPAVTPEMMSMATKMMAGMRPEDMAAMQAMASGGAAPGPGGMPDMSHLMTNPQMMSSMVKMLRGMDRDSLVNMMSGMGMKGAQAEAAADSLNKMSDKQFEFMLKATGVAQKGLVVAQRTKAWISANKALVIGLLILIIALLLRWVGVM